MNPEPIIATLSFALDIWQALVFKISNRD
jgi:hypothetical protein